MPRAEALKKVRHEILSGNWSPGERRSERVVAELLGMERQPVREALAILVRHGLLDNFPQSGVEVRVPTFREVDRVLQIRRGLETNVVAGLAKRRDRSLLYAIDELLEEMVAGALADRYWDDGVRLVFRESDKRFHEQLAKLAGLEASAPLIVALKDRIHLFRLIHPDDSPREQADTIAEHDRIVAPLRKGDARRAVRGMVEHLERTRARLGQIAKREGEAASETGDPHELHRLHVPPRGVAPTEVPLPGPA